MDKKTLEALKGSIQKWTDIANGSGIDRGPENCPLCHLFWKIGDNVCCRKCPVYAKTHTLYCNGTPHETWADHHDREHGSYANAELQCPTCEELALAELEFLESLLPKKKKVKK